MSYGTLDAQRVLQADKVASSTMRTLPSSSLHAHPTPSSRPACPRPFWTDSPTRFTRTAPCTSLVSLLSSVGVEPQALINEPYTLTPQTNAVLPVPPTVELNGAPAAVFRDVVEMLYSDEFPVVRIAKLARCEVDEDGIPCEVAPLDKDEVFTDRWLLEAIGAGVSNNIRQLQKYATDPDDPVHKLNPWVNDEATVARVLRDNP